jgi:hypothetical protein
MQSALLDVTTAIRFFAQRKAAFAVIVITMALALAANTTVFAVLSIRVTRHKTRCPGAIELLTLVVRSPSIGLKIAGNSPLIGHGPIVSE